jgi:hypothetical protein
LDDQVVFVGAVSKDCQFTVILDFERENILMLIYYIFMKTYPYASIIVPNDIKYYVFRYQKNKKVHTYLQSATNSLLPPVLSYSQERKKLDLMYAFLHINGNPIYVLDIIEGIMMEKESIQVTVQELALIVQAIYKPKDVATLAPNLKLHICDMNTMTEQIFKANDVISI